MLDVLFGWFDEFVEVEVEAEDFSVSSLGTAGSFVCSIARRNLEAKAEVVGDWVQEAHARKPKSGPFRSEVDESSEVWEVLASNERIWSKNFGPWSALLTLSALGPTTFHGTQPVASRGAWQC